MEEGLIKSYVERRKTIIPLVCRHPIFENRFERVEGYGYVEALYESVLDEFREKGMFLVYLCSPLKPTYEKSGRDHILDALYHASQITGAEYNGKKFAIWIPHFHGLTLANEFIDPGQRHFSMSFNTHIINLYHPTLVLVGKRISSGMENEIADVKGRVADIVHFEDFKEHLQNLPSLEEVEIIYNGFVKSVPPGILDHPAINRKMKRELSTQNVPRFHDVY